jgi:predicted nuclease of predicted toxin-antitoxin system
LKPTIIVDENVPQSVATYLNAKGFKTICVSEGFLKSAKDSIIAKYAAENEMQVLTLDSDFAQLYHNVFRTRITVFLVKANPTTATNIIRILDAALKKMGTAETQNKLIIITEKRIRIIS